MTHAWDLRVDASRGPTGCWPWTGTVSSEGYGTLVMGGRVRYAHVVACELTHGPMPAAHVARHLCHWLSTAPLDGREERLCCNPSHLEPGTHAQNADDRAEAGRGHRQRRKAHGTPRGRTYW